jgi:hypothetical protein
VSVTVGVTWSERIYGKTMKEQCRNGWYADGKRVYRGICIYIDKDIIYIDTHIYI